MLSSLSYVLISGNYNRNRINDKLCDDLGNKLAKHKFKIVSGGGKPAVRVAACMYKTLKELKDYDPIKIVSIFREKNNAAGLKIKRIGCNLFLGDDIYEMRDHLISYAKVLIVIGGESKTKEEILLAQQQNLPVIPIGMSGGTAYNLWLYYFRNQKHKNEDFLKLNNRNPVIASDAAISLLKTLSLNY